MFKVKNKETRTTQMPTGLIVVTEHEMSIVFWLIVFIFPNIPRNGAIDFNYNEQQYRRQSQRGGITAR